MAFQAKSTAKDYVTAKMFNLSPIYAACKLSNYRLSKNHITEGINVTEEQTCTECDLFFYLQLLAHQMMVTEGISEPCPHVSKHIHDNNEEYQLLYFDNSKKHL